ncbi:MAG: methyltransferase domain-containing protein [Caldilineaceae bacterium]
MSSPTPQHLDSWASGAAYEPYVGRWSRLVAREVIGWLAVPTNRRWLDGGCGTGAVTETILSTASPATVTGVDSSGAYLGYARTLIQDPRAAFEHGDLQDLPFVDAAFDAALSGLVLNFVPDQPRAVRELARVVRPGGIVAVYLWDYAGEMQFMRYFWDAAAVLDPAAPDEGSRFPICRPEPLKTLFAEAGLQDVEVRAVDIPTVFHDFDDFWTPFLGGQGAAPRYAMALPEAARTALREHLRTALPTAADGSIPLLARAWAARGTV